MRSGPSDTGHRAAVGRLVGVEQAVVVLLEAELAVAGDLVRDPTLLGGAPCRGDRPAASEPGVDVVLGDDALDLIEGGVHGDLHPAGRRPSVLTRHTVEAHRQQRRTPPSVASARPGADSGPVDHHDVHAGFALEEVEGGPESGESTPDDHRVAGDGTLHRFAFDTDLLGEGVVPQ